MRILFVKLFNLLPFLKIGVKLQAGGGGGQDKEIASIYVKLFNLIPILKIKCKNDRQNEKEEQEIKDANNKLLEINITHNTVAIMELCWHGEVFPSIVNYFLKLGYKVHLYLCSDMGEKIKNYKPLTRCDFKNVKIFYFSKEVYHNLFKDGVFLSNYKLIFIPSLYDDPSREQNLPFANIGDYLSKYKNIFYFIEHESPTKIVPAYFERDKRCFKIRPDKILPYCVCSYFGAIKSHAKNETVRFCVSGGVWHKGRRLRNFELFFESMRLLIKNNYTNFKVYFCGITWQEIESFNIDDLKEYCVTTGKIGYVDFYDLIEKSDFICWNIDDTCSDYEKYLNYATGTYGLSLGFHKPSIIEQKLAKSYEYDETTTLLYDTSLQNNLYEQMKRALEMPDVEYQKMRDNIIKLRERLEGESLENIRKITEREKFI